MIYEPTIAPTIGTATPTQDAIFFADEPRNATRHDADKPTPTLATPTVAWDALQHDIIEPKLSVATPTVAMLT
jgi:hypothetical protein